MLKIFNDLELFFKDNYRRINVREYARLRKISPPSASTLLANLEKEGLLEREQNKNYIFYFANKENKVFVDLLRTYWYQRFSGLLGDFQKELITPTVILFGSFSKAEIKDDSDIDIAVFTVSKKDIDISKFERKLKRKIQLFMFKSKEDVKNKELLNNILNGYILLGGF